MTETCDSECDAESNRQVDGGNSREVTCRKSREVSVLCVAVERAKCAAGREGSRCS